MVRKYRNFRKYIKWETIIQLMKFKWDGLNMWMSIAAMFVVCE